MSEPKLTAGSYFREMSVLFDDLKKELDECRMGYYNMSDTAYSYYIGRLEDLNCKYQNLPEIKPLSNVVLERYIQQEKVTVDEPSNTDSYEASYESDESSYDDND